MFARVFALTLLCFVVLVAGTVSCSRAKTPGKNSPTITTPTRAAESETAAVPNVFPVMLGIDVLEADGFAQLQGKRIGLLTHPAGVNRRGEQTVFVLKRAAGVRLTALYGPEHGIYGDAPADQTIADKIDKRTGLPVFSLYGKTRKPTPEMLAGIDALVIDLQDIGSRSYTFVSAMKLAIEACFENGKEVIVLDRPNPLGGLKVGGPPLDKQWTSYVGAFRTPYVHGLTIGELARWAHTAPGMLRVSDEIRARGKLTVIPMRGWRRSMRWSETGLRFVPTSPYVQDFAATVGYAMTGLGCQLGGFSHGFGKDYPFRALGFRGKTPDQIKAALDARQIPGLTFSIITKPDASGRPLRGVYINVSDWENWQPCDLSFHLMVQAAAWRPPNPFAAATREQMELFNKHTGSTAWWEALVRDGANVDLKRFLDEWRAGAELFQKLSSRYWLYQP